MTQFATILRDAGFRATQPRLALLSILHKAASPMSVKAIAAALGAKADDVTVYRALEALSEAGIVARVDLRHSHAHYELAAGKKHHHHLVCNSCGIVEDVAECPFPSIHNRTLRKSKKFAAVQSHSFELFGICTKCI